MALDFAALSRQVRQMSRYLAQEDNTYQEHVVQVRETYRLHHGKEAFITERINVSSTSAGLLACPYESFCDITDLPPRPPAYIIIAADGSQIERDRHGRVDCYLINIGKVYLRYGDIPEARLASEPRLYFEEADLYIGSGPRRIPIEGRHIAFLRDAQELQALVDMSKDPSKVPGGDYPPAIGLLDGTLIHWRIRGEEKTFQDAFLKSFLGSLDDLRERSLPIAGYTSRPRADEVIGTIRMMYCPHIDIQNDIEDSRGAQCNQCPDLREGFVRSCYPCDHLIDTDIFAGWLTDGQRSPIFISMSQVNTGDYREHRVHFFYLRVMRDIVRIEIPQWVARNKQQVNLIHSLVYDQCIRGQGYPVALARAHEQAVIRGIDRRAFLQIIEQSMVRAQVAHALSSKQESKEFIKT